MIITEFSKTEADKINVQELIVFLHTSNKQLETEIKITIYNSIKNRHFRINLTKDVQDEVHRKLQNIVERNQRRSK